MPVQPNKFESYQSLEIIQVTTTKQLTKYERFLHIANGTYSISLPPVAECAGMFFGGSQIDSGTNTVSIKAYNADVAADSAGFTTLVINAINEGFLVWSDGRKWHTVLGATS